MIIPSINDLIEWNEGIIDDDALGRLVIFFAEMKRGMEALGFRYSLAAEALHSDHSMALAMLNRRRGKP